MASHLQGRLAFGRGFRTLRGVFAAPPPPPAPLSRAEITCLLLLLALITAAYIWLAPRHALLTDDVNIYLSGARSLAEGSGYRFKEYEGSPPIGVYPPLQSAYLAPFWKMGGEFPGNIPWLNAAMILLNTVVLALAGLAWRRMGLPAWLIALFWAAWASAPSWQIWVFHYMSDMLFVALALGVWLLWLCPSLPEKKLWLMTGLGMALLYLCRSAAQAAIGILLLVTIFLRFQGRRAPVLCFAIPVAAAFALWKILSAGAASYGPILKEMLADMGGWPGYLDLVKSNLIFCARGTALWDAFFTLPLIAPGLAARVSPALGSLMEMAVVAFFWLLLAGAIAGCQRRGTRMDWTLAAIVGLYCLQLIVVPIPAFHFYRYLYPLIPFFFAWWWTALPNDRRPLVRRAAGGFAALFLAANAAANVYWAYLRPLALNDRPAVEELEEVAEWAKANVPPQARLACSTHLPAQRFYAMVGRPLAPNDIHQKSKVSFVTVNLPALAPGDYILTSEGRASNAPPHFVEAKVSRTGKFRIYQVR